MLRPDLTDRMMQFLRTIGLPVTEGVIEDHTFLPGILIRAGGLVVDRERLEHPGDLLHEGGHLAVVPSDQRIRLDSDLAENGADSALIEVAAIAWSYAACVHLQIDPAVVFHSAGYKGKSDALLLGFSLGVFPGVTQLQAAGLTVCGAQAREQNLPPYPVMLRWTAD